MPNSGQKNGDQADAGQKHKTEHDAPEAKRHKVDDETQEKGTDEVSGQRAESKSSDTPSKAKSNDRGQDTAVRPAQEPDVPCSILEKGVVYFFIRGRVEIDTPEKVSDIARSFILLRPIATDAKLGDGPIGDAGNTRLLALPKKVLPLSGKDRFMVFVEKAGASFEKLKEEFLDSSDYETKTAGTRHSPAATPVGEGIYAITTTGRESHLVYMLTLPEKIGEAQKKLGIKNKGSFIITTKNPSFSGPANARLPKGPDFSKEILDEFRSLRWLPSKPVHLDYPNAQILLIGESSGIQKATEPQEQDQNENKEDPEEVLQHLEDEDVKRMRHLADDETDSIYADLQAQAEGYPKLQTTF